MQVRVSADTDHCRPVGRDDEDAILRTHMLKAKLSGCFSAGRLQGRNTVEIRGISDAIHNPNLNSGEFAIIGSQPGSKRDCATLEPLGIRERLHNAAFNPVEFDGISAADGRRPSVSWAGAFGPSATIKSGGRKAAVSDCGLPSGDRGAREAIDNVLKVVLEKIGI